MIDLELDIDEAIILQAESVGRYIGEEEYQIDEIYLTNKSLILITDESDVETLSLNDIKNINGKVQVKKLYSDEHGLCMQVQFIDGIEYYVFDNKPKTATPEWVEQIFVQCQNLSSIKTSTNESYNTKNKDTIKCPSCGERISLNAKFCSCCGTSVLAQGKNREETTNERKQVYEGEIHKCPQCGEVLKAFQLHCQTCGYEIRGNKASSNIREFADELERLEAAGGKGKKQRIINHIRTFPIPNNKEDLYEFMILAASNIREDRYDDETSQTKKDISDAWKAKFEQAYQKAKISFKKTVEFEEIKVLYQQKIKEQKQARVRSVLKWVAMIAGPFLLLAIVYGGIFSADASKIRKENERLESIVEEVYEHIEEEEYSVARSKVASLVFSGSTTTDGEQAAAKWDTTRMELLEIIDKAEYGEDYVAPTREIRIGFSHDDLKGEDYSDVRQKLKNSGFTNIKVEPVREFTTGWWTSEGTVDKIAIDGETVFDKNATFPSDVEIIIYYHAVDSDTK